MRSRTWILAALLGGAVVAAPAGAQDDLLDVAAIREAMPKLREISNQGSEFGVKLHKVMDALDSTQDVETQRRLRGELRQLLSEYRDVKLKFESAVRPLLRLPASGLTNEQVLDRLRTTELHSVVWEGAFFDRCVRDLSAALKVPIRLQFRVVQKNTIDMRFQKVPAEMLLATLCNGFDLRYVIHGGEIVVYKKITPTEERFLDYQKRHPEVKLKYWEQEDASGNVDTSKKEDDR